MNNIKNNGCVIKLNNNKIYFVILNNPGVQISILNLPENGV